MAHVDYKVPPDRLTVRNNIGLVSHGARQAGTRFDGKTGRPGMEFGRLIHLFCTLPPPNSMRTSYESAGQIIQVYISNAQMPHEAWLVDASGAWYPLPLTLVTAR